MEILLVILWVFGWIFTLSKEQGLPITEVILYDQNQKDRIFQIISFLVGFFLWWIWFLNRFFNHLVKFFINPW